MVSHVKKIIFIILISCLFFSKIGAETLDYCAIENSTTFGYLYCDGMKLNGTNSDEYYLVNFQYSEDDRKFFLFNQNNNNTPYSGFVWSWADEKLGMCPKVCTLSQSFEDIDDKPQYHFNCSGASEPLKQVTLERSYTFFKNSEGEIVSLSYLPTGRYAVYKNGNLFMDEGKLKVYFKRLFSDTSFMDKYWKLDEYDKIFYKKENLWITPIVAEEYFTPFTHNSLGDFSDEYDVIFNSKSKVDVLYDKIDDWIKNVGDKSGSIKAISDFESKYSNLINQCDSINNAIANSKDITLNYDINKILEDLENSSKEIETIFNKYNVTIEEDYVLSAYDYAMNSLLGGTDKIGADPRALIRCDIQKYLNDKGIGNIAGIIKQHLSNIATCTVNLQNNLSHIGQEDKNDEFESIKDEFKDLIDRYGVVVIIDCEDLIGPELRKKLNEYMFYFRIIVPIVIIVLGTLDLFSAVLAADEDKMKKSQAKFIKRLMIGIAIFFVPTVINLILDIFNTVWTNISTDTCGF